MSNTILSAKGLNKSFGAVTAANNIDVSIAQGSCIGLVGTNGAGKTTFVNMMTGYLKPDSGSIIFKNEDITRFAPRDITKLGVCRSFQIPQLYNSMTVMQNLEVSYGILALAEHNGAFFVNSKALIPSFNKSIRQMSEESLERFKLTSYRDQVTQVLPGGIRKVLDIAMSMSASPEVLFLDEPTSGVSAEEKFDIMDMIMGVIRGNETTILFVEHDMEVVQKYSERVLAFYDGSIIADGTPEVALNDPRVLLHIVGESQAQYIHRAG